MPASRLESIQEGPAPEWQRWARNPRMLNRMIKDEARLVKRDAQRASSVDYKKVEKLLVTIRYLASMKAIDETGWDAIESLILWLGVRCQELWDVADSKELEDEDVALIRSKGDYINRHSLLGPTIPIRLERPGSNEQAHGGRSKDHVHDGEYETSQTTLCSWLASLAERKHLPPRNDNFEPWGLEVVTRDGRTGSCISEMYLDETGGPGLSDNDSAEDKQHSDSMIVNAMAYVSMYVRRSADTVDPTK
ncbi:hypothetical protein SCUP234_09156 [Seiridium cupressi]